MADFADQIKTLSMFLEKTEKEIQGREKKFVTVACAEIERKAKTEMRNTLVNPAVTYGKKGHHPSMPGHAPAPDSGTLMRSVTHEVKVEGNEVVGLVGSILRNPDYPKYLEYGTSKMKPRPWLSTAIEKSHNFIVQAFQKIMKGEE